MNRSRLLRAGAALLGLVLVTSGCASEVVVPGRSVDEPTPAAGAPAPPAPGAAGTSIPPIPPILIPDVTSLTAASQRVTDALGDLVTPVSGVEVTGARCDEAGTILNRASLTDGALTVTNNGDGSGSRSDGSLSVDNNGDGSGSYNDGALSVTVNGDGSGSYSDGALSITVNRDGSGSYSDGALSVTVNRDGSGSYSDGSLSITNNGDGSGSYSDGSLSYTNAGDGSGILSDGALSITNNGDGTGVVDGEQVAMPPLDPVPPVGTFPPVASLDPVGRPCGTLIRLSDRVLFDFDQAALRPDAGAVLDRLARALGGVSGPLAVNGHTDARGENAYNLDLSQRRAAAVVAGLQQRGVSQELTAAGFGEAQPIADNERGGQDHPAGRQLNRRVEIVVPGR